MKRPMKNKVNTSNRVTFKPVVDARAAARTRGLAKKLRTRMDRVNRRSN